MAGLTVTYKLAQVLPAEAEQTVIIADPVTSPPCRAIILLLPLMLAVTALGLELAVMEYPVPAPPLTVTLETCPTTMETTFWLKASAVAEATGAVAFVVTYRLPQAPLTEVEQIEMTAEPELLPPTTLTVAPEIVTPATPVLLLEEM